jgi:WXG100 family type VII secretion target
MSGSPEETDVEYADLRDLAAALATVATSLDGDLETLAQRVSALNSSWSGDAQQAFAAMYDGWAGDADDLRRELVRTAAALTRIADHYEETEAGVVSST